MRTFLAISLAVAIVLSGAGLSAIAIQLVSVQPGIFTSDQFFCNTLTRKDRWAANDWNTSIQVNLRDAVTNDAVVAEVTVPSGKVYKRTHAMTQSYSAGVCTHVFVPILGTDAETWQGAWRVSILLNGRKTADLNWEVGSARPEALAEYQAFLARSPNSARAHYQVGAAAALAGQDALGETELKEASRLAATWWYPYMALGRLYQKQGKREVALEQFNFLKRLMGARTVEAGTFTEYLQSMMEDHIKQLEP